MLRKKKFRTISTRPFTFFFFFVFRLRIDRKNFSSRHFIPFPSDRNGILFKSALMFTRNAESLERSCTRFQWVVDMLPSSGRVFLYVPFHGRVLQRTEFFKFFQSDPWLRRVDFLSFDMRKRCVQKWGVLKRQIALRYNKGTRWKLT